MNNYTTTLNNEQSRQLYDYLNENGFRFFESPYAVFAAEKPELKVIYYKSGKLLLQGKRTREFVEFVLEPLILKSVSLGYEETLNPDLLVARIGIDESGKGDYFGPLCIAGVYVNSKIIQEWKNLGIRDSKTITSDTKIKQLSLQIKRTLGCVVSLVTIGNEAYNKLYDKLKNVNSILAWGHARVIENLLLEKNKMDPTPQKVICDQFAGSKKVITSALMPCGRQIEVVQRHKAESDIAVAAASILARNEFVERIARLSKQYKIEFPKGCSKQVIEVARKFVSEYGEEHLRKVAKLHFKTTEKVLSEPGQNDFNF